MRHETYIFLVFSIVNVMRELQNSLPSNTTAQPILSIILTVTEYVLNSNEGKLRCLLELIGWLLLWGCGHHSFLFNQGVICTIYIFAGYTNVWDNLENFSLGSLNEITEQVNCFYFSKAHYWQSFTTNRSYDTKTSPYCDVDLLHKNTQK